MSARALVALRVVFVLALLPLATGIFIVTYQDASMTHLSGKWATVEMAVATLRIQVRMKGSLLGKFDKGITRIL